MDGTIQKKRVDLVIAKYQEELNWLDGVDKYKFNIIIYDKDKNLPNVGRESHTYLHNICLHYNDLADVTVFTQGSYKEHSERFFENIADIDNIKSYTPLSDSFFSYPSFLCWLKIRS